jgi:putative drug exporter of the RND superfamily
MASLLYRLGSWAFRRRRLVVAAWLAILVGVGALAAGIKGNTNDAFNVPGTESQRALDLLNEKFPGTGGATARIVFAAPKGHTLEEKKYRDVVEPTIKAAQKVPQTVGGPEAFQKSAQISKDKTIAFADLNFAVSVDKLEDSTKVALRKVAEPAEKAGLEVEFSGGVISTAGSGESSSEVIGLIVATIVLLVTFGALLPASLPLITALAGVVIGMLAITALTGVITVNSSSPTVALMLGLAVGIDYALFIVSRHRQNLDQGLPPEESAARAVATAGSAVCFAGLTVVIALVGLLVVGIPFLNVMGLAAAGTVVIAVLIALTLLPALLGFGGAKVGKRRKPLPDETFGLKWARLVTGHPVLAVVGVIAILGVIAVPAASVRLALPDDSTKNKDTTERKSYDLLTRGFGPGFTGPLTIVVDVGKNGDPRVHQNVADALGDFPDVAAVSKPVLNESGEVSIILVTPESAPADQATKDLVSLIRKRARAAEAKYPFHGYVTGTSAINIDTSDKLNSALPVFLVLVVGLALLLLTLVFRSLVVPIKAAGGFLLTIAASLGAVTFIFQQGHLASLLGVESTAPIISFLPVLMIAILFGLAMDYEVFLVSRMRESYVHTGDAVRSCVSGFKASSRVVTAAAIIMISVFAGFVLGDDIVIKSIGFALAFGVLVDAFLVRMTLVPAVMAMLGDRTWALPKRLDRRLPNLDIEGEQILKDIEKEEEQRVPEPV